MENSEDSKCRSSANTRAGKKLMEELNMRFDLEKTYKENKNINTKIQCKDSLHKRNLEIISIYSQRFY